MRKSILITLAGLPVIALAQQKIPMLTPAHPDANKPEVVVNRDISDIRDVTPSNKPVSKPKTTPTLKAKNFATVELGTTFYDLQSNSSAGRRVYLHENGAVSAVWTTTPNSASGFPLRGSGYNHKPAGGNFGPSNSNRIETERMGWPNLGVINNAEYVMAHMATNGGAHIAKNTSIGGSNWTTGPNFWGGTVSRPTWFRAANNGNTIHAICGHSADNNLDLYRAGGVVSPMSYFRSQDGGVTWDKQFVLLPGYDSTRRVSGSADEYAIDVRGNVVAIVSGGLGDDVTLWKSTNGGETFTTILVDSFPYAPFTKILALDTPYTNDGTVDVTLDVNDNAHVVFALGRVLDTDTSDDSYSFFPATNAIIYWNEITKTQAYVGGVVDENNNGTLDIKPGTWSGLVNGQIPGNVSSVARTGNNSLANMPSIGYDAQGRLFVIYSAPRELDENIDELNYRDVYISFSTDNGATWANPQNITQNQQKEDAFPFMAKKVDNFVHVIWQQDDIPGTNLQNDAGFNHPAVENKILYSAVPVSEIISNNIGQGTGVSVGEIEESRVFVVNQNFPNPFSGNSEVLIYISNPSDLTLTVTNILGKVVKTEIHANMEAGNHLLPLDGSNLPAGIYHYTISSGSHSVTRSMMVK